MTQWLVCNKKDKKHILEETITVKMQGSNMGIHPMLCNKENYYKTFIVIKIRELLLVKEEHYVVNK